MIDGGLKARRARLMSGVQLAILGMTLAMPSIAYAQDEAAAKDEEIVVTGSRIAREGFDASTPVSVVDAEDYKLAGVVNAERLLSESPQFLPSTNGGATSNTVPGGAADVNLRGFGNTRNLVLVNGRRYAIFGPEQVTDLNTIPTSLIERTEIVTGGSSAVYGSDAITGVVNFILRDDFEGIEARGQINLDSATTTPVYTLDLTAGANFADNRGNVTISANYMKRGGITRGERGEWAYDSFADGCVQPGTASPNHTSPVFSGASGAACTAAGGELGFINSGSGDIPTGRFSGIPLPGSSSSNPALNAAYAAAGLSGMGSFGFTFDPSGATARPAQDPADRFNLGPDNYLVIPQERWMINGFAHYDFVPGLTGYTELHYSDNSVDMQLAPSNFSSNTLFDVNNPYLSPQLREVLHQLDLRETGTTTVTFGPATFTTTPGDGKAAITAGRRYSEVGKRQAEEERHVFRGLLGFRGDIGSASETFLKDLHYDVYYSYAKTELTELLDNAVSRSHIQQSVLSVGGAAPVCNIFGANITEACANALRVAATNTTKAELQVASANISGALATLPAGDVGFSLGTEWRRSEARYRPDSFLSSGDVAGFNPGLPTGGKVSVKEIFGELRVPLIADQSFTKSLILNGAFRYSDYSLDGVGGVWTYLGGAEWKPIEDITLRGQYQRAIRAPNVAELYGGRSRSVGTANDPCSNKQPANQQTQTVRDVCVATGVPSNLVFSAVVQPNTIIPADFGGNPNLHEETSDTWTAGVVLTPSFLPRFRASIDWFKITLDDAIGPLGSSLNNTLNLCYNVIQDPSSVFCQAIQRDPVTGAINEAHPAQILNANLASMKTSGIDFAVRYNHELGFGLFSDTSTLDFSTDWTWVNEFTVTPVADLPNVKNECVGSFGQTCGEPIPEWRGVTRITWHTGDLALSLRHRFVGGVTNDRYVVPHRQGSATTPPLDTLVFPKLPAQNYIDLSFQWDAMEKVQIFGGANNIFDNDPPGVGSPQIRANTYPATYDVLGVEFFLGATVHF